MNVEVDFEITPEAEEQLKGALNYEQEILRIFAQGGGCSGTSYNLAVVSLEDVGSDDVLHKFPSGLRVATNKKAAFLLDGVSLGWESGEGGSGFRFKGQASKCCGKSCNKE